MSQPEMVYLRHKLSVAENGLTSKTGLTIKILQWHWLIIHPTSHNMHEKCSDLAARI